VEINIQREFRFQGNLVGGRPAGAYVLGLAFGFGWTPCIGPVLGAILTVSAYSSSATRVRKSRERGLPIITGLRIQ
tara:strand:- start:6785 stop:7012 length:228 start_codon:yes stop_codon:yes gene_type:complete